MIDCAKSDRTIGKILSDKAKRIPDKIFFTTHTAQVTYGEVDRTANRFANAFLSLGLQKGDKVSTLLNNCLEHIYCWFGLGKIGVVDVPLNTAYKGQILEYMINNSDSDAIVVDQEYLERIQFLQAGLKRIKKVIVYTPPVAAPVDVSMQLPTMNIAEFFSFPDTAPECDIHYSDLATIIYTSGTTGPSKGVMMSHAQCYAFSEQVTKNIGIRPDDIDYTCLPLFHANARFMCTYPCMLAEAGVAVAPRFSLSRFWEDIRQFKATIFNGLGAITPIIASSPPQPNDADNPIRLAFVLPLPETYEDFEKRFGLKVTTCYGMTEISLPTFPPLDEKMPQKTCGKCIDGYDLRIVDEYDEELPVGQIGELIVRDKKPYTMLSGYYNMPEKTLEAYRNLWYHTGDAMYKDENGWYYFVDRIKDAIRRRGENISSFEVESVVNTHPAVLESAAFAVKDLVLTEDEVMITVVVKPGMKLTPEELIEFCVPRMPHFHVPRYVEITETLPKTSTDKVKKKELRERGISSETWDREAAGIKIKR